MFDLGTLRKFPNGSSRKIDGQMGVLLATLEGVERHPHGDHYKLRVDVVGGKVHVQERFTQSHLWFWARGYTPEPLLCATCAAEKDVRAYPRRFATFGWWPLCTSCKAKELEESLKHPEGASR